MERTLGGGFKMSRQILPPSSTLGCHILVLNKHLGGSIGYLQNETEKVSSHNGEACYHRFELKREKRAPQG